MRRLLLAVCLLLVAAAIVLVAAGDDAPTEEPVKIARPEVPQEQGGPTTEEQREHRQRVRTAATADGTEPLDDVADAVENEPWPDDGASRVRGTVRDIDGAPAGGVQVRMGRGALGENDVGLARTGLDGRFSFPAEDGVAYWVEAEMVRRGPRRFLHVSREGVHSGDTLVLAEPPEETVQGTLVDEAGTPLAGVMLSFQPGTLTLPGGSRIGVELPRALTDRGERAGRFEVAVPVGLEVVPWLPDHPRLTLDGAPPLRAGEHHRVVAYRGVAIEGICVGPDGDPVGGAVVHVRIADRDRTEWSGENGRFRVPSLRPGWTYAVHARAFDVMRSVEKDVEAGATDVRLQLVRGRTVEGTLRRANGDLVSSGTLILTGIHGGRPVRHEVDVRAGRFQELGVVGSDLALRVTLDGESETDLGRLPDAGADGRIDLVLPY